MLKKETLDKLKALKLDPDKLIEAIKADTEVDFEIADGVFLTTDELTTRDNNKIAEGKTAGKTEGETGAIGTLKTELGKKFNKEFKGARIGDLAAELQELYNTDGNAKVAQLTEQINLLTKDKETLAADKTRLEQEKNQVATDFELIAEFPAKRLSILNEKEYLTAIKGQLEFKEDGVYKNGQLLRNATTQAALSRKEAIEQVFNERNWIDTGSAGADPNRGGRGGGNSGGGQTTGVKTLSQAKAAWKAQDPEKNINEMSPEFTNYLMPIVAADPQFNMNE